MSQSLFSWRFFRAVLLGGVISLAWATIPVAEAQDPSGAQDRAALARTNVGLRNDSTDDETGESTQATASPNDPDLGEQAILKKADRYEPWTFFATAPFSFTSNVALARSGEQSDVLFTPAVGISYAPRLTKTLFANISVGQQFFYYSDFDALNFASLDVRAGLVYNLPQFYNLLLRADYAFNRLTSDNLDSEFFSNHSINLGVELPFRFGRAQQLSLGNDLSFSIAASPSPPARHDYSWFVAYSANVTRDLTMSAVGRLAVRDYVEGSRTDVSGIFGLSVVYRFNKWVSASANSTFATNASNQDVFSYDVFNIGAGVAVNVKF